MFKYKRFYFVVFNTALFCALFSFNAFSIKAQSSDQNFPTPITDNTLSGTIKARDIGDSRLTTYYFTFNGNQGDIFVNVVTKNLNGDIDIFAVEGLRPLTKIVVYADTSDNETGRVVYLRKPEKIIMRIQGRSPNDDPATFQIKFAGSFLAGTETDLNNEPKLPEVAKNNNSDVIVNSVGTIIGVKPKPTPEPKPPVAEKTEKTEEKAEAEVAKTEPDEEEKEKEKPTVVVTENIEPTEETKKVETVAKTGKKKTKTLEIDNEKPKPEAKPKKEKVKKTEETAKTEPVPNPLENIRLKVLLKDGDTIEKPMSEVVKFGVEKAILTIVNKDGTILRYPILDVAKVTIE